VLESEFARLGIDPQKVTAKAPEGLGNHVFDLYGQANDPDDTGPLPVANVYLSWTEVVYGDCDQNGEVNNADLTAIGLNFNAAVKYDDPLQHNGHTRWPTGDPWDDGAAGQGNPPDPASPAANWRRARVDNDGNGEINISDITGIAQHWNEQCSGYNVYRKRWGEVDFKKLTNPLFPTLGYSMPRPQTNPGHPVIYEFDDGDLGLNPSGVFEYYVVPFDAGTQTEGVPSPIIEVDLDHGNTGTAKPVAVLEADPPQGDIPLQVTWRADGSYDLDGTITLYEWDTDGDNSTFEINTGLTPTRTDIFNSVGDYTRSVRVTDDDGNTAVSAATCKAVDINSPPVAGTSAAPSMGNAPLTVDFRSYSVDPDGLIEKYEWDPLGDNTWPIQQGTGHTQAQYTYTQPGIYQAQIRVTDSGGAEDTATVEITVNESGPEWHVIEPLGAGDGPDSFVLRVIDGNPALAWSTGGVNGVHYMRSNDGAGTSWDAVRDVSTSDLFFSADVALIDVNGRPGIAYSAPVNAYTGSLMFVLGDDASASSFQPVRTVDTTVLVSYGLDGEMVDGLPALVYRDVQNGNFNYNLAVDVEGTVWRGALTLKSNPSLPGYLCDLEIVGGRPAVATEYEYYRAANAGGTDWTGPGSIYEITGAGKVISMGIANGNPAIAYYTWQSADEWLYFVRSNDSDGASWGAPQVLDQHAAEKNQTYGGSCSFGTLDGYPFVFYANSTTGGLYFIQAQDTSGTTWSDPVCITISPAIGEISAVSSASGPVAAVMYNGGFIIVSFFESVGQL
jgi:PKD repeat protein